MDQDIRKKLQNATQQVRRLLEDEFAEQLEGTFDILADGTILPKAGKHLDARQRLTRRKLVDAIEHVAAGGKSPKEAVDEYMRESAFTFLNRFVALRMLESRGLLQECVSKGDQSSGFKEFCGLAPGLASLSDGGYRLYLECLFDELSVEVKVLFDRRDPASLLWPRRSALAELLRILGQSDLQNVWGEDETIGWVYQYFNSNEERKKMRDESQAPRNSREQAVRNQFFTPRYVVEFLTDNTLGRIWYEMRQGRTRLADECKYLVRRPDEVFLAASTCREHEHCSLGSALIAEQLSAGDPEAFHEFSAGTEDQIQRMIDLAHCVNAYDQRGDGALEWFEAIQEETRRTPDSLLARTTREILSYLFMTCRSERHRGDGSVYSEPWFAEAANEIRRRSLHRGDETQEELLRRPVFITYRPRKDPRDLKILDPACGSGHFLLYAFELLILIYEEAWKDVQETASEITGRTLQSDYSTLDELQAALPSLILAQNLHGIDIDPRAAQIAAFALWMRGQRAMSSHGVEKENRKPIARSNIVCAEPMPGEEKIIEEFTKEHLSRDIAGLLLVPLVQGIFGSMKLAGEAGALLMIEQEIDEEIRIAKQHASKQPGWKQLSLFVSDEQGDPPSALRSEDEAGDTFWCDAEKYIYDALNYYARSMSESSGYLRQLFSADTSRGFAFIEACRKRYDVVLMNPPFGSGSSALKHLLQSKYPSSKHDLYACFIDCAIARLHDNGILGAITSRTGFYLKTFEAWRRESLLSSSQLEIVADFGMGVLDGAMVETMAYCIGKRKLPGPVVFIKATDTNNRTSQLLSSIERFATSDLPSNSFMSEIETFECLPNKAIAYWLPASYIQAFKSLDAFENEFRSIKVGLQTSDDERFVRTRWEVENVEARCKSDRRWFQLLKGGGSSCFYSEFSAVVNWHDNGRELWAFYYANRERVGGMIKNATYYRGAGISWAVRASRFSPHFVPNGCVFSVSRYQAFTPAEDIAATVAILSSSVVNALLRAIGERHEHPKFIPGTVAKLPFPKLSDSDHASLTQLALKGWGLQRRLASVAETSQPFTRPWILEVNGKDLQERVAVINQSLETISAELESIQQEIDSVAYRVFNIPEADQLATGDLLSLDAETEHLSVRSLGRSGSIHAFSLLSWSVGVAVGRWDVEACDAATSDPLEERPMTTNGVATQGAKSGLASPHQRSPSNPCALTDDIGSDDDIMNRIAQVFALLFGDESDTWLSDCFVAMGASESGARRWVAKNFFDKHVLGYTDNRRRSPLYWQLATQSVSYSIWLYYHELCPDTFFRILSSHIRPKRSHEQKKLEHMRLECGPHPTSKQLREIECHEVFLAELFTFQEEVERIAPLWKPNQHDGVLINFSPLWRLVPHNKTWQKELKGCWDALVKGRYDWSHQSMHLWPERVVPKCHKDRSFAIAHGLESLLWVEDGNKWRPIDDPLDEVREQRKRRRSEAFSTLQKEMASLAKKNGGDISAVQAWQHLANGDWDDSAVAMLLWPRRVVMKCFTSEDDKLAKKHKINERALASSKGQRKANKDAESAVGGVKAGDIVMERVIDYHEKFSCSHLIGPLERAFADAEGTFADFWKTLANAEHDYSELSLLLWPDRIVNQCTEEIDVAEREGMRDFFWFQEEDGSWRRRLSPADEIKLEVARRHSPAVKAALESLLSAPVAKAATRRKKRTSV